MYRFLISSVLFSAHDSSCTSNSDILISINHVCGHNSVIKECLQASSATDVYILPVNSLVFFLIRVWDPASGSPSSINTLCCLCCGIGI